MAALASSCSSYPIKSLLRRNASRRLNSGLSASFFFSAAWFTMMMSARYEIRCSRLASGGTDCMSAPRSSSASARSLCLMSTPFTRATTGSAAEEVCVSEEDEEDESFEQPAAIGRTSSNAAMAASGNARRRGA
jgi:hypothetical protein